MLLLKSPSAVTACKKFQTDWGITTKSLYAWRSKFEQPKQQTDQDVEVQRLKAELARVTEEGDILKKATVR